MTIEFTGKVIATFPLVSGDGRNGRWSRATVVFEFPEGRYTTRIACENTNNAEAFALLKKDQMVKVKADVSSREYQGKWYNSIVCWAFEVQGASSSAADPI